MAQLTIYSLLSIMLILWLLRCGLQLVLLTLTFSALGFSSLAHALHTGASRVWILSGRLAQLLYIFCVYPLSADHSQVGLDVIKALKFNTSSLPTSLSDYCSCCSVAQWQSPKSESRPLFPPSAASTSKTKVFIGSDSLLLIAISHPHYRKRVLIVLQLILHLPPPLTFVTCDVTTLLSCQRSFRSSRLPRLLLPYSFWSFVI